MPFSRPCFKDSMERGAGEERGETWGLLLGMEVWHGLRRASLARIFHRLRGARYPGYGARPEFTAHGDPVHHRLGTCISESKLAQMLRKTYKSSRANKSVG